MAEDVLRPQPPGPLLAIQALHWGAWEREQYREAADRIGAPLARTFPDNSSLPSLMDAAASERLSVMLVTGGLSLEGTLRREEDGTTVFSTTAESGGYSFASVSWGAQDLRERLISAEAFYEALSLVERPTP